MEAIFTQIIEMSIAASWLIVAVILLRFILSKAPKGFRYILWALVAIRLICPFSVESNLSLVPDMDSFLMAETPDADVEDAGDGENVGIGGNDIIGDNDSTGENNMVTPNQDVTNPGIAPTVPETTPGMSDTTNVEGIIPSIPDNDSNASVVNPVTPQAEKLSLTDVLPWIWGMGAVILFIYMIGSYVRLWNRVKISVPIDDKIYICDDIQSPFIFGVIRPLIYIPSYIKKEQLPYILAHEKEHLKCMDHLWKPLGFLLLVIHWFNPLVWVAYVLMCRDLELACDERVIRHMNPTEKRNYSETLFACSASGHYISACPVAFGEIGIKERIKRVLSYKKPTIWVVVIAVLLCITVSICFMTDPSKAEGAGETESESATESESETESESDTETESEAETKSESETEPESETESEAETQIETPSAYEKVIYETTADLNHDGIDDLVRTIIWSEDNRFDLVSESDEAYIQVFAGKGTGNYDNTPCYTSDYCSTSHSANATYCLTERNGMDYLMYSNMYEHQGDANYEYCVFYLSTDQEAKIIEVEKELNSFATSPFWPQWLYSDHRESVVTPLRYEKMEDWISCGTILVALDVSTPVYYSTQENIYPASKYYDYIWARTDEAEIEEYIECNSSYPWQVYLYDLDCFENVVYLNNMLEDDLSKWFDEYNRDTLQRVPEGDDHSSISVNGDIIYYNAKNGEDVQSVLKTMIEAMIIPRMEPSQNRSYTITKYAIKEQPVVQISDHIWLVEYLSGYYAYEGVDLVTMEERLEYDSSDRTDGLVSFEGDGGGTSEFFYLLIEEDGVYRLQYFSSMYWTDYYDVNS